MLISRAINKGSFKGLFCFCATVQLSDRNKNGVKIKGDLKISKICVSSISVQLSRYIGLITEIKKSNTNLLQSAALREELLTVFSPPLHAVIHSSSGSAACFPSHLCLFPCLHPACDNTDPLLESCCFPSQHN